MEVKCLPYRIVYVVKLDFVMLFLSQVRWAKYCRCVGIINNNDYQQVHFVNKSLSLAGSCFWFCSLRIHASEIYLSGPGQAIISAWGQITERINKDKYMPVRLSEIHPSGPGQSISSAWGQIMNTVHHACASVHSVVLL